jgi:hypothetical protein
VPAEWTYVNGLTDPNYTINGLTPETKYEVQVMAYNADFESNWCDIVEFTTLDTDPVIPTGLRGDVNMSEDVTIADVTALIDYLLSGDATGISLENANCNLQDDVTIADVTALIDYLLSGNWPE